MALGHSSRDTFAMLYERGVAWRPNRFPSAFASSTRKASSTAPAGAATQATRCWARPTTSWCTTPQNGRAVYSFCMCPGGTVVAATSEPNRVVTNGMSQYSRNERNANAGMVVGIDPRDYPHDPALRSRPTWARPMAWTRLPPGSSPAVGQRAAAPAQSNAFVLGGRDYSAPGQLVGEFIAGKPSTQLGSVEPRTSPAWRWATFTPPLPGYAIEAMREALPAFGRKIKGFDMHDAVLTGVETRTPRRSRSRGAITCKA